MKKIVLFVIALIVGAMTLYQCTKETIYTCGDRNGDGIENELDCIGRDGVDGVDGKDGKDGKDGELFIYNILSRTEPSTVCNGTIMFIYADVNGNGVIDDGDQLIGTIPVCNGQDGADGQNGTDGQDGSDGADGTNGVDGATPTFKATSFTSSDQCPQGGALIEVFINDVLVASFELCYGLDGQDFVYNHSYEVTNDPEICGEAGGRLVQIFNEDFELVEQVELCFGMTYGELKDKIVPLRKYFEDVSVVYKEVACDHGQGYEVWVSIDDAEILHFYICPPPPTN